jgi:hypothetical protein
MMLRVQRHAMICLAWPDRIPANNFVGYGIDHGKHVLILQVDVYLARNRVELRHTSLAIETQSLDDLVLRHVNNRFRIAALVGDV